MTTVRLRPEHESWMMMSALLALCALLAAAVVVLPLFGPSIATVTAVGVVLGIVVVCYLTCVPRAVKRAGWANRETNTR
jgi:membrane protein YdbS with pleckstrin-like domain